jgi:hypothetical protein
MHIFRRERNRRADMFLRQGTRIPGGSQTLLRLRIAWQPISINCTIHISKIFVTDTVAALSNLYVDVFAFFRHYSISFRHCSIFFVIIQYFSATIQYFFAYP